MENKLEKIGQNSFMDNFVKTDDILKDMCGIIESSQKAAYQAVNTLLVQRNWLIGYRIAEEELGGDERSEYGLEVIKKISKELTQRYGKGYDRSNLYHCLKFYKTFAHVTDCFGSIFQELSEASDLCGFVCAVSALCGTDITRMVCHYCDSFCCIFHR